MWKFGIQKRDLTRVVNELKRACITRREELVHERYDAARLTSYTTTDDSGNYSVTTTGGDALALSSASHTREDQKSTVLEKLLKFGEYPMWATPSQAA